MTVSGADCTSLYIMNAGYKDNNCSVQADFNRKCVCRRSIYFGNQPEENCCHKGLTRGKSGAINMLTDR